MKLSSQTLIYFFLNAILALALFPTTTLAAIDNETKTRVEFAWEKARMYIEACLVSDECGLTNNETKIAIQILANKPNYSAASLKFVTESAAQFSSVDGDDHRLMLTGLTPNSTIYINSDRISGVAVETLIGLFAHELVHHLGIVDDVSRLPDLFGTRIASIARRYILPMNLGLRDTTALVFNYPQPIKIDFSKLFPKGLFPTIYLSQKNQVIIQELHMMPKETRNICKTANEVIWSSQAKLTSVAKASSEVTASFQFVSRCFDVAPPGKLQEEISYGATKIDFDPARNDAIGVATISFSKSPIDPIAISSIDVKLTTMPTALKAGEDLVVYALIETPSPKEVVGCGALIGADEWRESVADIPLTITTMDCKVTSNTENTSFNVEFKQPVSKFAPNQLKLKIQAVGLKLKSGSFIRGTPARAMSVTIENPGVRSKPITLAKVTASGATPIDPSKYPNSFYIRRGESFSFDIHFSSETTTSLVDGYAKYQAQMIDKEIMLGTTSLKGTGTACTKGPLSTDLLGTDLLSTDLLSTELRCGSPVDLLNIAPGKEAVIWAPNKIVFLTDDLQFASVDVSKDELAVVSAEKVP